MSSASIQNITALVLAGGRGSRMGGVDKGLQTYDGVPLALHALRRLQQHPSTRIATFAVNANRHLDVYAQWGVPVWPDTLPDQPGPLAGMLAGLRRCETTHLLCVPCDAPLFPTDLVDRLALAFEQQLATDVAVACAPDEEGTLRRQPVFALMRTGLADHLESFLQKEGRKVGQWMGECRVVEVPFDQPTDDPRAFANVNTFESLNALRERER